MVGLFLTICICCASVFSGSAATSSLIIEGDFEYRISGEKATLEKFWQSDNTVVTVPGMVQGYEVVAVGAYAFRGANVQKVIISEGIKIIEEGAFYVCEELTNVQLPSTLEKIESMAFANCFLLNHINIPKSLVSLDVTAFSNCTGLENLMVDAENQLFSAENSILFNKDKTELIMCPNVVKRVDYTVPSTVIRIGERAFYGCSYLQTITISDSVLTIGQEAFEGCNNLVSVIMGEGLQHIEKKAFPYEQIKTVRFYSTAVKDRFADYFTGAKEIICLCKAEHSYDNDSDADCNVCDYTREIKPAVPSEITSSVYTISDGYISKITLGTTVADFIAHINERQYIRVYSNTNEVSGSTCVGTGMVVKLMDGSKVIKEVVVVVTGDTNGDGNVTITDLLAIKSHLLNKSRLTGVVAKAADTSGDNAITITDFIQVKAYILKKGTIQAR